MAGLADLHIEMDPRVLRRFGRSRQVVQVPLVARDAAERPVKTGLLAKDRGLMASCAFGSLLGLCAAVRQKKEDTGKAPPEGRCSISGRCVHGKTSFSPHDDDSS
jgi:hypothetical protein